MNLDEYWQELYRKMVSSYTTVDQKPENPTPPIELETGEPVCTCQTLLWGHHDGCPFKKDAS